jgi:hypothetical protein
VFKTWGKLDGATRDLALRSFALAGGAEEKSTQSIRAALVEQGWKEGQPEGKTSRG